MLRNLTTMLTVLLAAQSLLAEDWPGWRGPRGDGTSTDTGFPLTWDAASGKNIRWRVDVPGDGHSSPVVSGDRVFLTTCLPDSKQRLLMCHDRSTGNLLWSECVLTAPLETLHQLNSRASGTPATDGETVYVAFLEVDGSTVPAPNVGSPREITPGRVVVAAYDVNGEQQWIERIGEFVSAHGFCSCPVIYEDLLIINGDHDGDSYITALDRRTGETVWSVDRAHGIRSYVTPIVWEAAGRTQLVLSGSKAVTSLDPRDGSTIWSIEGPTEQFVASMVFDGERFFMAAGFPDYHLLAIRPDGTGDVTDSHVAWHSTEARCYVPSPVVVDGYLLVANDDGISHCFDAATGDHLWRARLGRHFSSSLVTADGLVHFLDDDGITKLVRPGRELEVVAENTVSEFCCASPALSEGELFIRTEHQLFCIAEGEARAAQ